MDLYFLYARINSKWISNINVKNEAIQILEENIGGLYNPEKGFLIMTQKSRSNKGTIIKFDYVKKCMVKSPDAVRKQIRSWEKIFETFITKD